VYRQDERRCGYQAAATRARYEGDGAAGDDDERADNHTDHVSGDGSVTRDLDDDCDIVSVAGTERAVDACQASVAERAQAIEFSRARRCEAVCDDEMKHASRAFSECGFKLC
jgi:hypothetical protein